MTYFGKKISYGEMFQKIEEYSRALKKYGISQGDYVSICLPNIPEVIYFKYALNRIGAIANMIDPRTNPERILSHVNNSNSKLLISILDICNPKIDEIVNKVNVDDILVVSPSDSLDLKSDIKLFSKTSSLEEIARNNLKMAGEKEVLIIINNPPAPQNKKKEKNKHEDKDKTER